MGVGKQRGVMQGWSGEDKRQWAVKGPIIQILLMIEMKWYIGGPDLKM